MSIPNAVEMKGRRNGDVYSRCSGTEGPEEWRCLPNAVEMKGRRNGDVCSQSSENEGQKEWRCLFPIQWNRRAGGVEMSIPNAVEMRGRRNEGVYSQCNGIEGPEEWRCLFLMQWKGPKTDDSSCRVLLAIEHSSPFGMGPVLGHKSPEPEIAPLTDCR